MNAKAWGTLKVGWALWKKGGDCAFCTGPIAGRTKGVRSTVAFTGMPQLYHPECYRLVAHVKGLPNA